MKPLAVDLGMPRAVVLRSRRGSVQKLPICRTVELAALLPLPHAPEETKTEAFVEASSRQPFFTGVSQEEALGRWLGGHALGCQGNLYSRTVQQPIRLKKPKLESPPQALIKQQELGSSQ
jgi:hypothetical protein